METSNTHNKNMANKSGISSFASFDKKVAEVKPKVIPEVKVETVKKPETAKKLQS